MTSSLVGSEMCIRDRPLPGCMYLSCWLGLRRSGRTCRCGIWYRGLPGPVSYTHLTLPTICSV
eukprot:3201870-Prorocentrum_lima.AAC.1